MVKIQVGKENNLSRKKTCRCELLHWFILVNVIPTWLFTVWDKFQKC